MDCPVTRFANCQVRAQPLPASARAVGDIVPAGKSTSVTLVLTVNWKSRTSATPVDANVYRQSSSPRDR